VQALPQVYVLPQPSETSCPQPWPAHAVACAVGVQHTLAELQTCPLEQLAMVQLTAPPQPSSPVPPQLLPQACTAVFGVQQLPE
jgi:hypothetical protein